VLVLLLVPDLAEGLAGIGQLCRVIAGVDGAAILEALGLGAAAGDRERGLAIALDLLAHALGHRGEDLLGNLLTRLRRAPPDLRELADIGPVLDLPQRAPPVRVVRAELLLERREPVTQAGVADLDLHQIADAALDVAVDVRRRLLLHPEEVLLVERLDALHRLVEIVERFLDIEAGVRL